MMLSSPEEQMGRAAVHRPYLLPPAQCHSLYSTQVRPHAAVLAEHSQRVHQNNARSVSTLSHMLAAQDWPFLLYEMLRMFV